MTQGYHNEKPYCAICSQQHGHSFTQHPEGHRPALCSDFWKKSGASFSMLTFCLTAANPQVPLKCWLYLKGVWKLVNHSF